MKIKEKIITKKLKIIFVTLLFLSFLFISFRTLFFMRFSPIPYAATNSYWSYEFLQSEHSRNFSSIENLFNNSLLVLRVKVLDRNIEVFGSGDSELFFGSANIVWEQFYTYQLEVLEIFKGTLNNIDYIKIGDTIEVFQQRKLSYESLLDEDSLQKFDVIPLEINVGDDLIVFLITNTNFLRGQQDIHTDTRFARLRNRIKNFNGFVFTPFINHRIEFRALDERIRGIPRPNSLFIFTNQVQAAYRYDEYTNIFESVNIRNNLNINYYIQGPKFQNTIHNSFR